MHSQDSAGGIDFGVALFWNLVDILNEVDDSLNRSSTRDELHCHLESGLHTANVDTCACRNVLTKLECFHHAAEQNIERIGSIHISSIIFHDEV